MVNPLTALLIGTAFMGVCLFLFWPGSGIVARWNSRKSTTRRSLMENALKHLYNCEYESVSCSIETLAGNLSISSDEATLLLTRLEIMGLVSTSEDDLKLTNDGRSYALRVIRVHRLWEKYLADETSVEELDIPERRSGKDRRSRKITRRTYLLNVEDDGTLQADEVHFKKRGGN